MSKLTFTMISLTTILATSSAWAIPVQRVPEPGMLGIVAAGMVAVVIAARLRNRK